MLPFTFLFKIRFKRRGKWHVVCVDSCERAYAIFYDHLNDGFSSEVQLIISCSDCNQYVKHPDPYPGCLF